MRAANPVKARSAYPAIRPANTGVLPPSPLEVLPPQPKYSLMRVNPQSSALQRSASVFCELDLFRPYRRRLNGRSQHSKSSQIFRQR